MTLFYCAHWQTYVSGTLRFGKVDVTEAQVTIMIIQLVSAIFGSSVWTTKVTIQGLVRGEEVKYITEEASQGSESARGD